MACRYGDPALIGFARWCWALQLIWLTARGRASRVLTAGISELGPSVRLRGEDTLPAEMLGFLHTRGRATRCTHRVRRGLPLGRRVVGLRQADGMSHEPNVQDL
jgi:hypothetical protein